MFILVKLLRYGKYLYKIQNSTKSKKLEAKRKYTLKDLAGKANINYHTLLRYEQGTCGIPIEKLKVIANTLDLLHNYIKGCNIPRIK